MIPADYLATIVASIAGNRNVLTWQVIRSEVQGDSGLFRYRVTFLDYSMLEMFERFRITETAVEVTKFSFHWQDKEGRLRRRWHSAAHHPELDTHPYHVHIGDAAEVASHEPVTAQFILSLIDDWMESTFDLEET